MERSGPICQRLELSYGERGTDAASASKTHLVESHRGIIADFYRGQQPHSSGSQSTKGRQSRRTSRDEHSYGRPNRARMLDSIFGSQAHVAQD